MSLYDAVSGLLIASALGVGSHRRIDLFVLGQNIKELLRETER